MGVCELGLTAGSLRSRLAGFEVALVPRDGIYCSLGSMGLLTMVAVEGLGLFFFRFTTFAFVEEGLSVEGSFAAVESPVVSRRLRLNLSAVRSSPTSPSSTDSPALLLYGCLYRTELRDQSNTRPNSQRALTFDQAEAFHQMKTLPPQPVEKLAMIRYAGRG